MSPSATQARMQKLNIYLNTIEEVSFTEYTKVNSQEASKVSSFYRPLLPIPSLYSFCIKKCGESTCEMCQPVHLPSEVLKSLHFLPDPVPSDNEHYQPFDKVYESETTEMNCPSLIQKSKRQKTLPFTASMLKMLTSLSSVNRVVCGGWSTLPTSWKHKIRESLRENLTILPAVAIAWKN